MNSTEAFLRYVLSILLKNPEKMSLEKKENSQDMRFYLRVSHDDAGRVIGRHGRTISAIRGLMQVSAARANKHALLILEDEEKHSKYNDKNKEVITRDKPNDFNAG